MRAVEKRTNRQAQKNNKKPIQKKNDIFFKSAFEDYFCDMLRFLYKDADQIFDLEKPISFMDKELLEISQTGIKKAEPETQTCWPEYISAPENRNSSCYI